MQRKYLRHQFDIDAPNLKRLRNKKRLILITAAVLILLGVGGFVLSRVGLFKALFTPISFVASFVNPVELQKDEGGRVNVLLLGLDTRGSGWSGLTDTILIGSFSTTEGKPVLISIPRDFWVSFGGSSGGKINTAYNIGGIKSDGTFDFESAIGLLKPKVEEVLGMKIPYYAVVNFEGFKKMVDTLGGVKVCVDKTFDDYNYPTANYGLQHVHFNAGCQTMNGDLALKFVRSRNGTNGEGNDFARARRQQKVILGVKEKIFTLDFLLDPKRVASLFDQLKNAVKINLGLGELQRGMEIAADFNDISSIDSLVLDPDSGLTFHPKNALFSGAYVIVPIGGDTNYTQIHKKVRELLYGAVTQVKSQ